jgi:cytochrome c5
MRKILFIVIAAALAIGCATVSNIQPKETDLAAMQQKVPGISLEEAHQGFKIYKFNCGGCHNLHKPTDYTISGWQKVLPEMLGRAKITSEKEAELLMNYLFAKSK